MCQVCVTSATSPFRVASAPPSVYASGSESEHSRLVHNPADSQADILMRADRRNTQCSSAQGFGAQPQASGFPPVFNVNTYAYVQRGKPDGEVTDFSYRLFHWTGSVLGLTYIYIHSNVLHWGKVPETFWRFKHFLRDN